MNFNTKPNPTNKTNAPMGVKEEFTSWGVNKNQTPYSNPSANKQEDQKKSWEDDEDEVTIKNSGPNTFKTSNPSTNNTSSTKSSTQSVDPFSNVTTSKSSNPAYDYEVVTVDENFLKSHEHEAKIISDITQSGGARVKQSDQILREFSKACESLQVSVVGSFLFHKLNEDIEWVSKARALFAIEIIVKNVKKFFEYFKFNIAILKRLDFSVYSEFANAVTSLDNVRNQLVKYIDDPSKGQEKIIPQNFKTEVIAEQFEAQLNLLDEKPQNKKDAFDFLSGGSSTNTNVKKETSQKSNKIDPFNLSAGTGSGSSQGSDKNPFGISKPTTTTVTTNVLDILDGGDDSSNNNTNSTQTKKPTFGKFKKETTDNTQTQQQTTNTTTVTNSNSNKASFDPFGLSGTSTNNQQQQKTTTQPSTQSSDLISGLGNIDFSTNTNQNQGTNLLNLYPQTQNQGGFNQNNGGFNGGFNMGFNQNYFNQNTNSNTNSNPNQNMNQGFNPMYNPNYNPNFNPNYNPNFGQGGFNYNNQGFQQQQQQQQQGGNFGNQFNPFGTNNNNNTLKTSNGSGNTTLQNPDDLKKKKEMEEKEKYFDNLY